MKSFLKTFLAVILAIVFINIVGILILVGLTASKPFKVENNSILKLDLKGAIVDRATSEEGGLGFLMGDKGTGLNQLKRAIKAAKDDDNIKGILLTSDIFDGGHAALKELREALIDFKESGKFIYAHGEIYMQKGLYVTSVADSVFAHPNGYVDWRGLAANITYLRGFFDMIGIEPEIFRGSNNKYKSAGEPLMAYEMSDENRRQIQRYLNVLWNEVLTGVAESRNLDPIALKTAADSLWVINAEDAAEAGLIDREVTYNQLRKILAEQSGREGEDPKFVSMSNYISTLTPSAGRKNRVAVLYAEGDIEMGPGDDMTIGSDRFARSIRKLREDDNVKAVVLRINSPGGVALAGDVIYNELKLLAEKKPLVASMGDVAASAGYMIATPANEIFAQPTTITGSIGVLLFNFNAQELTEEKLKIKFETVSTTANADLFSGKKLTPYQRRIMQKEVDRSYNDFVTKVAHDRAMQYEEVDTIAQGRVWPGVDALRLKLVDKIGSLEDAVARAAELAEIEDDYNRVDYLQTESFGEMIQRALGQHPDPLEEYLGPVAKQLRTLKKIEKLQGKQARLPFELVIE